MNLKTPTPLKLMHEALHADINRAIKLRGRTGKAARLVARLIEPHYAKEEKFALPPLSLLPALAEGTIDPQMAAAVTMAKQLHDELPDLIAERHAIVAALEELMAAAQSEGKAEMVGRAERMMLHEETKEQVHYPATILIGKYLQLRLKG
jgi:hypothetical protein